MTRKEKQKLIGQESIVINKAISLIDFVRVSLHRIVLSGYGYDYKSIKAAGKNIKILNIKQRRPNYNTQGVIHVDEDKINNIRNSKMAVFLNPKDTRFPWFIFEYSYPSKTFLIKEIDQYFENVTVSSVEYTIDIFSKDIPFLYSTLLKYLYFPYQKNVVKLSTPENRNEVFRAGKYKNYTRGRDKSYVELGWDTKEVDRIRIEFTAGKYELKKLGIRKLYDFTMEGPKFESMLKDRLRFKRFKSREMYSEQVTGGLNSVKRRFFRF